MKRKLYRDSRIRETPPNDESWGDLGRMMRERREANEYSLLYVASSIGVNQTTLSRWERGKDIPTTKNLLRWLAFMNVKLMFQDKN